MTCRGVVSFIHTGSIRNAPRNGTQAVPYGFAERSASTPVVPTMRIAALPLAGGPCLSLWERWPSAARTERVNVEDSGGRYHLKKRCKALSVSAAPSQLSQRESQGPAACYSGGPPFLNNVGCPKNCQLSIVNSAKTVNCQLSTVNSFPPPPAHVCPYPSCPKKNVEIW